MFGVNPNFMDDFLSGEVGLLDLGRRASHKHESVKKSLESKEAKMPELNKGEERVKFAHLELMKTDATRADEPKAGLFRGLKVRSEGSDQAGKSKLVKYIIIGDQEKPSDVFSYNLGNYNIMSMTLKYGDTTELVVFKADAFDQKQALEVLGAVLKELQDAKFMVDNDPEIVDVKKYTDVPKELGGAKIGSSSAAGKSSVPATTHTDPYAGTYGHGGCAYNNEHWRKQREEREKREAMEKEMRWTPTKIAREGEAPEQKMLNLMKKKIAQIASGDYEYDLPDVKEDDDDDSGTVNDCTTCTNSTASGFKDMTKPICKHCTNYSNYDDGEDYDGAYGVGMPYMAG